MTSQNDRVKQLVRAEIRALDAYHVPAAGDLIKLDAMENPWPWSESLRDAWLDELRAVELNRYPDPSAEALLDAMRSTMSVPGSAGVILGNGSDELIQMIVQTVSVPGRTVLAPEPTFVMYRQISAVAGMSFVSIPLQQDFSLDADAMLAAITQQQPAVTFLAYPNNPTGNLFDAGVIHAILSAAEGLVVVDEAYAPFTDASFMSQLQQYDNLLVLRTVSKMGLAGLRLGLLAGPREWLEQIDKTRLPYNLGTLNQVTGRFAMQHKQVFDAQARKICEARSELLAGLQAMSSLTVYPSEANFILFRVPPGSADTIYQGLQEAGLLVKNLHGSADALQDCLRVTVGLPGENKVFLKELAVLL